MNEVLDLVHLTERADDRVSRYSLGMKQRLGVASALLKDPALVVLDEPSNGLDPAGMAEMRVLVQRLAGQGRTVLLSSHQLGEVEQVCDRIGVISGGMLLGQGTVNELRGERTLRISAEPLHEAQAVLCRIFGVDRVWIADGVLQLNVDEDEVPHVNRELVVAGISVLSLGWHERGLEDVFFELTTADQPREVAA